MVKRTNPDSVRESCSKRLKRRVKLDKDVISPREENFVKKSSNNFRSYPVYGKNSGLQSDDKRHSSSHDIQKTDTKKNEAFSRSNEDGYYVSRISEEASSHRNIKQSGSRSGDKCISSLHDIQITDTKKKKVGGRSFEDRKYISRDVQEASSPRNKKKRGLRSDDKCYSSSHDIRITDTKKNKGFGRSFEGHNYVSRDSQEATSPQNRKRRGLSSGDKCYSSSRDIRITDTKKNKGFGRSFEGHNYVSRDSQEATSPQNRKRRGLSSGDKCYSSSHDIRITDTKKNKGFGRSFEGHNYVSRDGQEATSPRNRKRRGLSSGDKCYLSSHDIRITDTKKSKTICRNYNDSSCIPRVSKEASNSRYIKKSWSRSSCNHHSHNIQITDTNKNKAHCRSFEDSPYVAKSILEASFPRLIKHRKPYRGSCTHRSSNENYATPSSRFSGNVLLRNGCNESSHFRSQIFSVEKQADAVTNSIVDSGKEKTLPQTHPIPSVAKRKGRWTTRWGKRKPSSCCEFKSGIMDSKRGINGETASDSAIGQKNETLLDNSSEGKQSNFVDVEGSQVLFPADLKGSSVRQPPISGVVEELNFPMRKLNKLDSSTKVCANFSFHTEKEVLMVDSSLEQLGEASTLDIQDGLQVLTIDAENDFINGNKHMDIPTNEEKEIILWRSNVLADIPPSDATENQDDIVNLGILLAKETLLNSSRKKLLILDLNGLLADINQNHCRAHMVHKKVGGNLVFKRPFCDDFLEFCFKKFHVAVWSSRKRYNVDMVVDYLLGNLKHKLLFCWDGTKCTDTGYKTLHNKHKPLVLKELKKLWNKQENDLPWVEGEYSPLNTLLVDDSPYKAICNPPHTAIFPHSFNFTNKDDNSLGPGGDLRVYLERLATVDDVQDYVRQHPFGQKAITDDDPSWSFYSQIIDKVQKSPLLTS